MIMIRSKEFGLSDMGGGVNENGGLVNRLDKIAAGINTWCWWSMMLIDTRNLWTAYLFIVQRKLSDIRLGSIQGRKEYGGYRKRKVFAMFVFLVLE